MDQNASPDAGSMAREQINPINKRAMSATVRSQRSQAGSTARAGRPISAMMGSHFSTNKYLHDPETYLKMK